MYLFLPLWKQGEPRLRRSGEILLSGDRLLEDFNLGDALSINHNEVVGEFDFGGVRFVLFELLFWLFFVGEGACLISDTGKIAFIGPCFDDPDAGEAFLLTRWWADISTNYSEFMSKILEFQVISILLKQLNMPT